MPRHARIVLRQLRISGQAASVRAATHAGAFKYEGWSTKEKRRVLGDHFAMGAVMQYVSGGGGAVELEFVVLDRNRAFMGMVMLHAPDVILYGGAMNFTASKIVLREHSQAGQSTGGRGGGPDPDHAHIKFHKNKHALSL